MRSQSSLVVMRWSALLGAMLAVAVAAEAQPRRGGGITVYADINFNGASQTFQGDVSNLVASGFNDTISSIEVADGEVWQICRDINYQNRCENVSGRIADLRAMNWNDQISSMRRLSGPSFETGRYGRRSPGIVVYVDVNFSGRSAAFRGDVPDLVGVALNDQISSVEIPPGEAWEVCVDVEYSNRCTVLTESVADLRRIGWNDRISSFRRVDGDRDAYREERTEGERGLIFFDRPYFRGSGRLVTRAAPNMRMPARGSVRISGGGAWEICDEWGTCATIDRDVDDLGDLGLGDRITAVRELRVPPRRWPR